MSGISPRVIANRPELSDGFQKALNQYCTSSSQGVQDLMCASISGGVSPKVIANRPELSDGFQKAANQYCTSSSLGAQDEVCASISGR